MHLSSSETERFLRFATSLGHQSRRSEGSPMPHEDERPDVTRLIELVGQGDPQAARELLPVLYDELRRLAAQRLSHEAPGQTIDATSLVHEAYLRLVGSDPERPWNGRGHFFGAAAEAMRRILVERARHKRRLRHGGALGRIDLDRVDLDRVAVAADPSSDDLLALDEALDRLAAEEPAVAEVVKLRYFAGLPIEGAADALGISVRTANRHWAYARAWLYQQLNAEEDPTSQEK
jgi:RNA polymerase sigma factor (TIGR02999 family)